MKSDSKTLKTISWSLFGLVVLIGSYNAVMISSDSYLSEDMKFLKRLDETLGVTVEGRSMAGAVSWEKLDPKRLMIRTKQLAKLDQIKREKLQETNDMNGPVDETLNEELSLGLVEVINPHKYSNGLSPDQFHGNLSSAQGMIESLSVSLPNGEGLSVSFSELNGNVFEYEMNGEVLAGMLYQVDKDSFMVTLTNGPLEGTRLRFTSKSSTEQQEQVQESLAQKDVQIGSFGDATSPEAHIEAAQAEETPAADFKSVGFNLTQPEAI
jgi:hypothetical protein